jgi:hypothetical protein
MPCSLNCSAGLRRLQHRRLSQAWPDAELLVIQDAGHLGNETWKQYVYGRSTGSRALSP